ncbi:MAG: M20/M25/M40 family metallo-hydrolase [Candidatus Heimdallarchaeota archaeon]|nr:M20/M25/M40 family metallo-hydrolase [Candidatus Heimdallarchaeota archaeon]
MDDLNFIEAIELLQELIQNQCINPPGNELKSIKSIENFLRKNDIECEIFESAPNRGNLIAIIKGNGTGPNLLFGPSHVDVVPIERIEEWIVPPFSGEIKDGFVWGRGAVDMLFIVAAQIQAFNALKKENFTTTGDLVLVIVSDEEMGGKAGIRWLLEHQYDKLKSSYAVSEMGGIHLSKGKVGFFIGEKGASWVRMSFKGTPKHGSMPYKSDNAIIKAATAVQNITKYNPPLTTKYIKASLHGLGYGAFVRFILTRKILLPLYLKVIRKKDPQLAESIHSLTRMTISPNIIKGGLKANIIAATALIDLDIRTLPGQDYDYIIKHIRKALGKKLAKEVTIELIEEESIISFGNSSLFKSELTIAIEKALNKIYPNSKFIPMLFPAATDLRFLRERNIQCCGVSLFEPKFNFKEVAAGAHGINEKISLKTFENTILIHYYLAKELLKRA